MKRIPNLDTFSAIIDRLIIEVHKVATLENKKREEHMKSSPNLKLIAKWDHASREACECRAALKGRLDEMFKTCITSGEYDTLSEARTF